MPLMHLMALPFAVLLHSPISYQWRCLLSMMWPKDSIQVRGVHRSGLIVAPPALLRIALETGVFPAYEPYVIRIFLVNPTLDFLCIKGLPRTSTTQFLLFQLISFQLLRPSPFRALRLERSITDRDTVVETGVVIEGSTAPAKLLS